jgi:DNA replication licensing factor MCM2
LQESNAFLAKLLINVPAETLKIFDDATWNVILEQFENYSRIQNEVHVRITELPTVERLCDLRNVHLNTLVRVSGVVTRRSNVFPQMKLVKYNCVKCGHGMGPFVQDLNEEIKINSCGNCQSKGPFVINAAQTVYRNFQKITLQESPGSVPAGRLPRHKEVILLSDLIDAARPGEEIEVTGIYRNDFSFSLNAKNGFPVFSTIIEANYICKSSDKFASFKLTEDDVREIRRLAADPRVGQRIIGSIAPSIFGHDNIKTAIALSMFGGQPKNIQGKHQLRGDINVLILGDPVT